jgi:hypothetical protein
MGSVYDASGLLTIDWFYKQVAPNGAKYPERVESYKEAVSLEKAVSCETTIMDGILCDLLNFYFALII